MCWIKVAAGSSLIILAACGSKPTKEASKEAAKPAVQARAATVTEMEWPETLQAPGTIRARTTATLSSRAAGYIREIKFHEGDRVEPGAVVATIEAREMALAAQQAQAAYEEARSAVPEADSAVSGATAQLTLAETTLRRMQDLLSKRSVSQQEFDEAEARVRVARSGKEMAEAKRRQLDHRIRRAQEAVAAAEVQLEYLEVKAPFSGRIIARKAEPGMLATPGMPLYELERDGTFRLEAALPESHLRSVRTGQTAEVLMDSSAGPVTARVEEVVPEIDAASRTFVVKLALPAQAGLRSGQFGRATFRIGQRKALTIPPESVIERGQLRMVMIADNGVARSRAIRLGERRGGAVEVLSGLEAGERVIMTGAAAIGDGQRVEVIR